MFTVLLPKPKGRQLKAAVLIGIMACFCSDALARTTFQCEYTFIASAFGKDGDWEYRNWKTQKDFSMSFIVEKGSRQGLLVGNNGSNDVDVFWSLDRVTLIETAISGTKQITVIYFFGEEFGPLMSVHLRTTSSFLGDALPSINTGSCLVR